MGAFPLGQCGFKCGAKFTGDQAAFETGQAVKAFQKRGEHAQIVMRLAVGASPGLMTGPGFNFDDPLHVTCFFACKSDMHTSPRKKSLTRRNVSDMNT